MLILSATLAAGAQAAPILAVSDNSEVFLTGKLGVRQDSNIYLTHNAVSDTIFDIDPGLQFVFGNTSAAKGTLSVAENVTAYSSHSSLNSNLLNSAFDVAYEDGKTKASLNAGYNEYDQNTYNINAGGLSTTDFLIRRNVTNGGASGEVAVTEKTSVGLGLEFNRTDYRLASFSDADILSIPLNYYYELTPKLDASVGYTYRATWQQLFVDSVDNFYNVGLRGELTPKLTGTINAGVTDRRFSGKNAKLYGLDKASLFGINSSLAYALTPKASLQFGIDNDFDANAQGQQEKDFSVTLGGTFNLADEWSFNGSVAWRQIKYTNNGALLSDRTDYYWDTGVGLTYKYNAIVSVTAGAAFRSNVSGRAALETNGTGRSRRSFDDTVFSLAANFRY